MIGPKKLHTVRQELQRALSVAGEDPIRWLEERMAAPPRQGAAVSDRSEVLQSLKRFLEGTDIKKSRHQRAGTKR